MPDDNKLIESLGELSGLMKATREDIKNISVNQKEQWNALKEVSTNVKVLQTTYEGRDTIYISEFTEINNKLSRDYDRLNGLEKDKYIKNGIDDYKDKKREYTKWILGICGAIVGLLLSINQLLSIKDKITGSSLSTTSVYASEIDTTKNNIILETDTIKVNF